MKTGSVVEMEGLELEQGVEIVTLLLL